MLMLTAMLTLSFLAGFSVNVGQDSRETEQCDQTSGDQRYLFYSKVVRKEEKTKIPTKEPKFA